MTTRIETIRFSAGEEDWAQDQVDELLQELSANGVDGTQQEVRFASGLRRGFAVCVRDEDAEKGRKARNAIIFRRNRGEDRYRNYKWT